MLITFFVLKMHFLMTGGGGGAARGQDEEQRAQDICIRHIR
jgi:hypothetical protein